MKHELKWDIIEDGETYEEEKSFKDRAEAEAYAAKLVADPKVTCIYLCDATGEAIAKLN